MGTHYPDIFAALAAPFVPDDVKVRAQAGRQLHYITARTAMNRLDDVLGPENWWDEFVPGAESVLCRLTIRLPDGSTLTKADAGGYAGMADSGDDDKSGFSDAFKRACVKFGVARYLYRDGVPSFVQERTGLPGPKAPEVGAAPAPKREIAAATAEALTPAPKPAPEKPPAQTPPPRQTNYDIFRLPPAGKAVFGWAKNQEQHYETTVVPRMADYGKDFGWGTDFRNWTQEQANRICMLVVAWLKTLDHYKGEWDRLDTSGVNLEAVAGDAQQRKAIKLQIIETIKQVGAIARNRPVTDAEIRHALDRVSARSVNASGSKGEVCQSLNDCNDMVWLKNMLKLAHDELTEVTQHSQAGGPEPEPEEEAEVEEASDIPF